MKFKDKSSILLNFIYIFMSFLGLDTRAIIEFIYMAGKEVLEEKILKKK